MTFWESMTHGVSSRWAILGRLFLFACSVGFGVVLIYAAGFGIAALLDFSGGLAAPVLTPLSANFYALMDAVLRGPLLILGLLIVAVLFVRRVWKQDRRNVALMAGVALLAALPVVVLSLLLGDRPNPNDIATYHCERRTALCPDGDRDALADRARAAD